MSSSKTAAVDSRHLYICPDGPKDADGSLQRPFMSIEAASHTADADDTKLLELVYLAAPGNAVDSPKVSRTLYIDSHSISDGGDGTERDPWSSYGEALEAIGKRVSANEMSWSVGQSIRIKKRAMFTATTLERKKARRERLAAFVTGSMAMMLVIPVVAILAYLVYRAWPSLTFEFLVKNPKRGMTEGGIWAPLIGTFYLVAISLLVSAPIGILAGVYLNEYAKDNWWTRIINLAVVNLAGVPSIVHGLFGVGAFVAAANMGKSLLAASCTLAVMTLPVIIASTKEALGAVPMSFREACWNLGASRWQTIRTIVLPNSISGILTGVILQVSRAAGETAPILFTGVAFSKIVKDTGWGYWFPFGLDEKFMALSNHLFIMAKQNQNASDELVYAIAVVLIGLVLAMNSLAIVARLYLRARAKW